MLDHRHAEATAVANATQPPLQSTGNNDMLHLPAERLAAWLPVRAMVESSAAGEDDVSSALQKAKEATSGGVRAGEGQGEGVVDFLGFLEFVHNLDLEASDCKRFIFTLCSFYILGYGTGDLRYFDAFDVFFCFFCFLFFVFRFLSLVSFCRAHTYSVLTCR